MIEIVKVFLLRHESGLYISVDPDNMPHTMKLSKARKFYSMDKLIDFLSNSFYRPDNPEEYEVVDMTITYRLEEQNDVQQE